MESDNSPQQDENALVERVFLRIGSAETDEQLQTALGKFLAPLLLKLNSPHEDVRSKVIKLLAHIKTRLKSRNQVQLPLDALLTQFQDPQATPFITNFTILYIKLGFPRTDPKKQAELVPLLINCLEGRSIQHQNSILQLIIPALGHLKMPENQEECRVKFSLKDKTSVKQLLLDYFMDILLLPYNSHVAAMLPPQDSGMDPVGASAQPPVTIPPGLSKNAFERLTAENPMTPEALEKAKLSILKFLGSGVVDETEVVCLYVVASSDTRHSVATFADMELRKITGTIDWNSKEILGKLYSIFQGTVIIKGMPAPRPEDRKSPVSPRIRLKIFPFFLKAREASNMFPASVQIVFDCLFGATQNAKLRNMAVQFIHHICLNCEDALFSKMDGVLLNGMLKLIDETKEDEKLRSLAYVAVGKIGRRSPHQLTKDLKVVQKFFEAMSQEQGETRLAVHESLSMMTDAFRQLSDTNKQLLEALLLQNIDMEESQVRSLSVQYAATIFSNDHIPSRFVLMLGTGDMKDELSAEAVKSLRGTQVESSLKVQKEKSTLPDFVEMINYVMLKAELRKSSKHRHVAGNRTLPFVPKAYLELYLVYPQDERIFCSEYLETFLKYISVKIMIYLRMCLAHNAGLPVIWNMESLPEQVPKIRTYVETLMAQYKDSSTNPLEMYAKMLVELLSVAAEGESMYCLLEVTAMMPELMMKMFTSQKDWLKSFLRSSKDKIQLYGSELYAIVCSHLDSKQQFLEEVIEFQKLLKDKNPDLAVGAVLSLGFLIGQYLKRDSSDMETDKKDDRLVELQNAVKKIATLLEATAADTRAKACIALGEIGRNAALPVPEGKQIEDKEEEISQVPRLDDKDVELTKLLIVQKLMAMIKTSNEDYKTKERAAACLGNLSIGDKDFPHRKKVMTSLMNAVQSKQVDLQFTIGQALLATALGPKAPSGRNVWTTTKEDFQKQRSDMNDELAWLLDETLSKFITSPNPHARQGACIWLLTLICEVGQHKSLQDRLLDVQRGFMRLLSENDEITQDLASKGLGQVMEVCTPEQKDSMVSELVETLMTGKRTKTEVSSSTTIFQQGALGTSPDGGGLSTYKELCSIATDLNQPDLIYKFMHLANHNASWNARKGAAFGFSTIAAQAGEQLAPYLTQIVPRLYRYQFDPNPKIQQAMSGIWNALVQDNKKTVDTYLKEILNDLLKNLVSNQWRVRESSCIAVSDLLRGRVLDDIIEDLPTLWEVCLKVRDDIKESVRNAAEKACKTLSRVSVKVCDSTNGKVGEKATSIVLPCLLKFAVESSVSEVRAICLFTILEICRNAGALVRPCIPVLVPTMLDAVSGLEPQAMNYLSLHMGSQENQEKLDSARIAASKSSPMMETVNRCVQYIDATVLPLLVPKLIDTIKNSIGLGSKAGCASFVVSLVHQCQKDLQPYSSKFVSIFCNGISDRNAAVRKSYASALSYLVRVTSETTITKMINKLRKLYVKNEDSNDRIGCCVAFHALSRNSPDCLRDHASVVMPLAFFAMHEAKSKEEEAKGRGETSEWEDIWNEISPGTEAGIRLYLPEITEFLAQCMESHEWSVKAQAGRAMVTIATKVGPHLKSPHLDRLLSLLLDGLSGRTWTGKESFLKALQAVCTLCKDQILQGEGTVTDQPSIQQVVTVVLRESGKEHPVYKVAAFECLGQILELYQIDTFKAVWEITKSLVKTSQSADADDDIDINQRQELIECAYVLLGRAWPHGPEIQNEMSTAFVDLLCSSMTSCTWKVQVVLLKDMHKFIERSHIYNKDEIQSNFESVQKTANALYTASLTNLGNSKSVALRTESLNLIEILSNKLKEGNHLHVIEEEMFSRIQKELVTLAESGPWELRDKAKALSEVHQVPTSRGDNSPEAMEH